MVISIRPASLTPLSDIALALDLQNAGAGQELRSRDGERLIVKDGPSGRNRCGGRDSHRSRAVRIISTALTEQLIGAGMDKKDAEPATAALVRLVRPLPPGSTQTLPLTVRHVASLVAHAKGATRPGISAKAYCDALVAAPDSKAAAKPQAGARLVIPRPINDNRIIELIEPADFQPRRTVTIERLAVAPWHAVDKDAKGVDARATRAAFLPTKSAASSAHWAIMNAQSSHARRARIDEAIDAARECVAGGRAAQARTSLFAALKACAAQLTPPGTLAAPDSDVSLWIRLAEGLYLEDDKGSHLCTVAQLRSLSLSDRSSVLLALALGAKRAQLNAPDQATRAYRMLSYLLEAITDEDLMPPALRSAELRFQEAAAAEFELGSLRWATLRADERQALLVRLARHHATCLAYRMPELKFGNHLGRPVMLALAEARLPIDTGDSQRWSSFEKMAQRLGQDLLPFCQFDLARQFESGTVAAEDVEMARLMCVGNLPPLSKEHLARHVSEPLARLMDAMAPTARQISLHAPCWLQAPRPHLTVRPNGGVKLPDAKA
jgi:hypothetical protein